MGSAASYSASVVVRYKRDIVVKTPNTDEKIEDFLKLKNNKVYKIVKCEYTDMCIENIKDDVVGFLFTIYDEEYDSLKQEDFFEYVEEYQNEDDYIIEANKILIVNKNDLYTLNLDIAYEYEYIPENVDKVIVIGSVSNDIYAYSDNQTLETLDIPQNILSDCISNKCTLELYAAGNAY